MEDHAKRLFGAFPFGTLTGDVAVNVDTRYASRIMSLCDEQSGRTAAWAIGLGTRPVTQFTTSVIVHVEN